MKNTLDRRQFLTTTSAAGIAAGLGATALSPMALGAPAAATDSKRMRAGVAVVDITPPKDYPMRGYYRPRYNEGTLDPLLAKAVVFRQGDCQAAMVFCDLIGIAPQLSKYVRAEASKKTGIPVANIVIAATHTHTGPGYSPELERHFKLATASHAKPVPPYVAGLLDKLVQVIVDARAAAKPVDLQVGVASQQGLSFNRRFHMKEGPVRFNPGVLNPNIVRPAGPIDPDVDVLLFRDGPTKQPLASLTVFALHLDTTGGLKYSADFPYYLAESLKQELGPSFVSMFGNGTCGDINHIDVTRKERLKTKYIGETLAATVKAELPKLANVKGPSLAVRSEIVQAPKQQYSDEEVAWAKSVQPKIMTGGMPFLERVKAGKILNLLKRPGDSIPLEVQAFRISNDVAVVSMPGEVFVDLGLAIKKASPFPVTFVVELANDAPGYVPTKKAFAEGSYETVNSRVQPGGGEMMVDAALRLLGHLKND